MAAPVEKKVTAATAASLVVGVVVAVLNSAADASLLGSLPEWLQSVILALVPPILTFLSGWQAKHTPRESGS